MSSSSADNGPAPGGSVVRHLRWGAPTLRLESEPAARQAILSTAGVLVQGIARFAYSVLIGNLLGKLVLGSVSSAISLALLASLLVPSATAMAATKYVAMARGAGDLDRARSVVALLGKWTAVAMLVLALASVAIAIPVLGISVTEAVFTGALAATYSGYVFVRGWLFGASQVTRATVWDLLTALLALAGLIAIIPFGLNHFLLAPLVLCYGLYAAVSWPRRSPHLVDPELRRQIRGFLWLTLVNSVVTGGFLQLTMVAAQYWDRPEAGAFAAALSLATPASLVSRSVALVLFPSLSEAHGRGDTDGARRQVNLVTRGLMVISLVIFGALILVSPLLIALIYPGDSYLPATLLLPILLAAVMLSSAAVAATNSLLSGHRAQLRVVTISSVAGAAIGLVWWVVAVPSGGVLQVAVGYLVGSAVVAGVPVAYVAVTDRHRWGWPIARFLLACAVLAAGIWWEHVHRPSVLVQLALAVAFVLVVTAVSVPDLRLLLAGRGRPTK